MAEPLRYELRGPIAWLTLDRPQALNSLTHELLDAIALSIETAIGDRSVRCLVITGAGEAFCAGADLKFIESLPENERDTATAAFLFKATNIFARIADAPKPVIAAINGSAIGGGLELVLACDLAVASRGIRIGDGHANFGLFPGAGSCVRLPRRIGPSQAKQLLFTGGLMSSERLTEVGLINEVVDANELYARTQELAELIASKSPLGIARMKQMVNASLDMSEAAGIAMEQALSNLHTTSFDRNEGLAAFKEKRRPEFIGQ